MLRADAAGTGAAVNAYDEYGVPDTPLATRFGFTGQAWVPEAGLYYYKARMYSPTLGRFMQTDPIGYADGMNMYAYVGNDPVNGVDPWGLKKGWRDGDNWCVNSTVQIQGIGSSSGVSCYYDPLGGRGFATPVQSGNFPADEMNTDLEEQLADCQAQGGTLRPDGGGQFSYECVMPQEDGVDVLGCLGDVAWGGLKGFGVTTVITTAGEVFSGAQNRTAPEDRVHRSPDERAGNKGIRVKRDARSAGRITLKRFIPALLKTNPYFRGAATLAGAGEELLSSGNCGIEVLP